MTSIRLDGPIHRRALPLLLQALARVLDPRPATPGAARAARRKSRRSQASSE
jgi:hypothetical protein